MNLGRRGGGTRITIIQPTDRFAYKSNLPVRFDVEEQLPVSVVSWSAEKADAR